MEIAVRAWRLGVVVVVVVVLGLVGSGLAVSSLGYGT